MSFAESVRSCLSKYGTLQGRASRAEYWWFVLACWLAIAVVMVLSAATQSTAVAVLAVLVWVAAIVPQIAAAVRRLHDTGRSGWWWWFAFVPFGGIAVFVFLLLPGDPLINQYGPPPIAGRAAPALA